MANQEMMEKITEALYAQAEEDGSNGEQVVDIRDIQEAGYMTGDDGLCVYLENGEKFLLTIQKA